MTHVWCNMTRVWWVRRLLQMASVTDYNSPACPYIWREMTHVIPWHISWNMTYVWWVRHLLQIPSVRDDIFVADQLYISFHMCSVNRMLRFIGIPGITLQRTATHCNTLQHNAAHCSTLQHTATHCGYTHDRLLAYSQAYAVATISRLLKIIGLSCKTAL